MSDFAELVEDVKSLQYDELIELQAITEKLKVKFEREELLKSHLESVQSYNNNELTFSSDFNAIKNTLKNL
jgi:hypothetical protein